MGLMKEVIKEMGNKSREFYEFVLPAIDMHLTDKNLKVIIDIPGFSKKDIELSLSGDILSIKAEKIMDEKDSKTLISNQRPNKINKKIRLPIEIKEGEEKNSILIMNRYYHSNLVYGLANGLKQKWLENLDDGLPKADLVILLDVTQKESFLRSPRNEKGKIMKRDKFEKNEKFSRKISKLYRTTAKKKHWKIIDASKPKLEVHEEILKAFSKKLGI